MTELNKIHHCDFLNNRLPDKCAKLIISDPPYFEVKGDFDFQWKSFDAYLQDVEKWAIECKRLLSDNGTLFWWGHAQKIAYSQIILDKYFKLENSIIWKKKDSMQRKNDFNKARRFLTHNERVLMYSSGVEILLSAEVLDDERCFLSLKEYLKEEKKKSGLTSKEINKMYCEYIGKKTNLNRSTIEHYWAKKQWKFPSEDVYKNVLQKTGFWKRSYSDLKKEFEALRNQYHSIAKEHQRRQRHFNNYLKLEEVFEFSQETNKSKFYDHETIKPETLSRCLILTCSTEGDLVVVPFAGSGTECAMSFKEGRSFVGFDNEKKNVQIANNRVNSIKQQPSIFNYESK